MPGRTKRQLLRLEGEVWQGMGQGAGPGADAGEERNDGLGDEGLDAIGAHAIAGKVHVRGGVNDAHPLTFAGGITREIVPRSGASLPVAVEGFVAGAGENKDGFADGVPGVFGKDDARTFGGKRYVGVEAVLTGGRRGDSDLVAGARFQHDGFRTHGVTEQDTERRAALAIGPSKSGADIEQANLLGAGIGYQSPDAAADAVFAHVRAKSFEAAFTMTHDDGGEAVMRHGFGEITIAVFGAARAMRDDGQRRARGAGSGSFVEEQGSGAAVGARGGDARLREERRREQKRSSQQKENAAETTST